MPTSETGQPLRHHINDGNLWKPTGPLINEVLGRMQVAQAPDPVTDLMDSTKWIAGQAYCRPEIVPWPWGSDEIGTPFDQASLWGVRFNAYNPALNSLVAVPRSLPGGYERAVPRGQWQSDRPIIAPPYYSTDGKVTWKTDGTANLFVPSWSLRSPPGTIGALKRWGPMNFADKSGYGGSFDYNTAYYYIDPGLLGPNYKLSILASSHIGFRGARITISDYDTPGFGYPTVYIGWSAAGSVFTAPALPSSLTSVTFSWADAVPSSTNPHFGTATYNVSLSPPNSPGTLIDYWAWIKTNEWSPTEHSTEIAMSPRTDVPFWFDVVGINDGVSSDWHAPGGYIP